MSALEKNKGRRYLVQIILNYKSYYDVFKLGVVNNGFKPVAEVLFYPLFHPHTLCDANGTP